MPEAISEKDNDIEMIVSDRKLAQLAHFELGVTSHFLNLCALSGYLKEIGALVNTVGSALRSGGSVDPGHNPDPGHAPGT